MVDAGPVSGPWPVISVTDGDTVRVEVAGVNEPVRMIGIDSPETVSPNDPVQCFGAEATAFAVSMLEGRDVYLEPDPSQGGRDAFDRLLAYVWLEDGRNYNDEAVARGYATEYTYDDAYRYQRAFREAETQASASRVGLWAPTTCAGDSERPAEPGATSAANGRGAGAGHAGALAGGTGAVAGGGAALVGGSDAGCDPNYQPCVPPHPPDLDCADVGTQVRVVGPADPHRLDGDGDGGGCESFG